MKLKFNIGYILETALFHKYLNIRPEYCQQVTNSYLKDSQWFEFLNNLQAFEIPKMEQL